VNNNPRKDSERLSVSIDATAALIRAARRLASWGGWVWSWIRRPVFVLAAVLALAVVWGAGIEPRLTDEVSVSARLPGLPDEWSGESIALIADLQIGMWLANTDTVRRIVRRVVEERPAALLIAGDFLYHPTKESGEPREARADLEREDRLAFQRQIRNVVALLQPLTDAGIRTIAVLGNHDYAMRVPNALALPVVADELTQALRAAGVIVLRNQAAPLGDRDAHRPSGAPAVRRRSGCLVSQSNRRGSRARAVASAGAASMASAQPVIVPATAGSIGAGGVRRPYPRRADPAALSTGLVVDVPGEGIAGRSGRMD
jgi:hypothetical protein